ncbi:MAG: HNH endonuclease [Vagococcus salmoninarum]|uniref:HNH endonuclease n=1 Tax=Vagococcus salmoninarum TaxID=2739 RepID=UPI003F98EEB1
MFCTHAGCREVIPFDKAYCSKHIDLHKPKSNYKERLERDSQYIYFYKSKSWRNMSKLHRINHPICKRCYEERGIVKKVDVVDHIIEIKDDWNKRLDGTNLQSLCHSCHNFKTNEEKRKRSTPKSKGGM